MSGIDNPMWMAVARLIENGDVSYMEGTRTLSVPWSSRGALNGLLVKYQTVIVDPEVVDFVRHHAGAEVVHVNARSCYWGYILRQLGRKYTIVGKQHRYEKWGQPPHEAMFEMHRLRDVVIPMYDNATLLSVGAEKPKDLIAPLSRFQGPTVIIIGRDPRATGVLENALKPFELHELMEVTHRKHDPVFAYFFKRRGTRGTWAASETMLLPLLHQAPR